MDKAQIYRALGQRVQFYREQLGLTQEALALTVGYMRTSISNIEAGRQHFDVETLYRIANALNAPMADLLPEIEGRQKEAGSGILFEENQSLREQVSRAAEKLEVIHRLSSPPKNPD
jgi:transcriptional regulator with XRE-family HTH domain